MWDDHRFRRREANLEGVGLLELKGSASELSLNEAVL
jgi:hypothetical protein